MYDEIAKLKENPGKDIVVFGSRALWNDLLDHGLVDELHFMMGSVVLGDGTPIFVAPIAYDDPKTSLHLIDTRKCEGSNNLLARFAVKHNTG